MTSLQSAADPNTPPDALLRLIQHHPGEVLHNPAFALMLVENPGLWREVARKHYPSALALGAHAEVPPEFVEHCIRERLAGHLLQVLLHNPAVPEAQRVRLFTHSPSTFVRKEAWRQVVGERLGRLFERVGAQHNWDTPEVASDVADEEIAEAASLGLLGLAAAVRHPRCPLEVLERAAALGNDSDFEGIRATAAGHARLPLEWLHRLAESNTQSIRSAIGGNPSAPSALLRKVSRNAGGQLSFAVAGNPNLPDDVAEHFAARGAAAIRRKLASNPGLKLEVMRRLAKDDFEPVRAGLARNPSAPDEICKVLANDGSSRVRGILAKQSHLPDDVLAQLCEDKNRKVAQAARRTRDRRPCGSTS